MACNCSLAPHVVNVVVKAVQLLNHPIHQCFVVKAIQLLNHAVHYCFVVKTVIELSCLSVFCCGGGVAQGVTNHQYLWLLSSLLPWWSYVGVAL